MKNKPVEKQFWKYVIPSMLTMLLSGFYTIVDGFFVGRSVGDTGLAAINMAWPIAAFVLAIGVGIGTGGAVLMSMLRGEGRQDDAKRTSGNTVLALFAGSVLLTAVLYVLYPYLLRGLGATGVLFEAAEKYIRIIILGCGLQIFGAGLTPLLRNNGQTVAAMLIMITGLITNVILDAWFIAVLGWGMAGAAFATIIAQGIVAIMSIIALQRSKAYKITRSDFKPDFSLWKRLLRIGISPFGLSFSPSIIIIFNNWQCLRYGNDAAVAAYAVVSYFAGSVQLLLSGAGEGIQPLISYCRGARMFGSLKKILSKAVFFEVMLGIVLLISVFPLRYIVPVLFGTSQETAVFIHTALFLAGFAFPLIGLVRLSSSYFYAVGEHTFSLILIYADPVVTTPLMLLVLPLFFGLNGVWAAYPASQCLLMLSLIVMYKLHAGRMKRLAKESANG